MFRLALRFLAAVFTVTVILGARPSSAQSIDLDHDGVRDILLQDPTTGDVAAWLMNNQGEPTSFVPVWYASDGVWSVPVPCKEYLTQWWGAKICANGDFTDSGPWRLAGTKDLNLDGMEDILLQSTGRGTVIGWIMSGDGRPSSAVFVDWGGYSCGGGTDVAIICTPIPSYRVVATPDIDGDGVNDVVWQGGSSWMFLSSQGNQRISLSSSTTGWTVAGASDVNGDGVPDLILQHTTEAVGAWLMNRAGQITDFVWIWEAETGGWKVVGVTDLNDDGIGDILLQYGNGVVGAWLMNQQGEPQAFATVWGYDASTLRVNGVGAPVPVIDPIPTVIPRTNVVVVPFTVSGGATGVDELTITARSSNQSILADANIVVGGSGTNRTLSFTTGKRGTTTVTLTATDRFLTVTRSFAVAVPAQVGDFDGDGKTDVGVYRSPGIGMCYVIRSSTGTGLSYYMSTSGNPGDIPAPGDFNGDGVTECVTYRPGTRAWSLNPSASSQWPDAIPVVGDYNGDGKDQPAVFQTTTGIWHLGDTFPQTTFQWGIAGDIPVQADYDGDGKTDVAVFRPSTGIWYIQNSSTGSGSFIQWGLDGDVPLPGDFDGDGAVDTAVFRPSTGIWYIRTQTNLTAFFQWGLPGDMPVTGDYDGDGRTELAVYRPSLGMWYILDTNTGEQTFFAWGGEPDDIPLP